MAVRNTPGVYIVDKNAFPNSVVEVATAVPAFVGYTEKADNRGQSLLDKPWRITSMAEFHQYFGFAPTGHARFSLTQGAAAAAPAAPLAKRDATPLSLNKTDYVLSQTAGFYLLYYGMSHFFENGGGPCYIVSVGAYRTGAGINIEAAALEAGIDALEKEQEPTMVVVPEAVLLAQDECVRVQRHVLRHCGEVMKNRIAILDIWEGYRESVGNDGVVPAFRDRIGLDFLAFGAAYYPWVNTTIVQQHDLGYINIDEASRDTLKRSITDEIESMNLPKARADEIVAEVEKIGKLTEQAEIDLLAKTLPVVSPFFKSLLVEMRRRLNVLPPSAAMAGVYTMVDNARGVWKAPANVSLISVVSPTVALSTMQQEDLNVTPQGKSINAIRDFVGQGTLVWGARTLDGNSPDWRYINVRRTLIMLAESIRLAARSMAFEPNVANTWLNMKSMIHNFLTSVWKRGGLAGAVPEDAFSVRVGLGETMTPADVLDGIMRITVLVAISRPAEFIAITFEQQMQKS